MQVSVVIPVYNAEPFVAQAVRSALDQPETAEVILIEDGSPDGSLAACEDLVGTDPRVRLLRHPGGANRGAGASRNLGIKESRFPFIAFLDADDLYLPGRFSVAREVFERHPEADGVYSAVIKWATSDENRIWKKGGMDHTDLTTVLMPLAPDQLFGRLIQFQDRWHTSGITVKKALFERTGLFDEHLLMSQDTAMWLKMAAVGTLLPGTLTSPIAVYRFHGGNRVVRHADLHPFYRCMMLSTVAKWARAKKLPGSVQHILLEQQLQVWDTKIAPRYRIPRLRKLAFLLHLLIREPVAFRDRTYYTHLSRALGTPSSVRKLLRHRFPQPS